MNFRERLDEILTWDLLNNATVERVREVVLEAYYEDQEALDPFWPPESYLKGGD